MPLRLLALAAVAALPLAGPALAQDTGDTIHVSLDHARVIKIDAPAETIIIGNPSVVDVAIHDASTLILTGRSYGVTNFVVLDAGGEAGVGESIVVDAVETASVRVYRQDQRTTYSCSPTCQPTMTVGDVGGAFDGANQQFLARESFARPGQ